MPTSQLLPSTIKSVIALSTNSTLVAIVVVFKIASLVPLLFRWNFPLLEIPRAKDSTWLGQESADDEIKETSETVARIGRKRIVVRDPSLMQKVFAHAENKVNSPSQVEYYRILDQAEHDMQAALKESRNSTKKIGHDSIFDELQLHSTEEERIISELWAYTKLDPWAKQLVSSIFGNIRVRKLLQEELSSYGLLHQTSEPVGDSTLRDLRFLQACVAEAIRTNPPLHLLDVPVTIADDLVLKAYRIPAGTSVVFDYHACLNAACFGPDVQIFQPERWMTEDPKKLMDMDRHIGILWSKSPSQRLTIETACMQMRKLIFNILQLRSSYHRVDDSMEGAFKA